MKAIEFTGPQLEVLRRLAKPGEYIHRVDHARAGASYFWHGSPGLDHVRANTIWKFSKLGLIEDFGDLLHCRYRITKKGAAALAAHGERPAATGNYVGAVFERKTTGTRFTIEKQDSKFVYYWLAAGSRPQFRPIAIENLRSYRRVDPRKVERIPMEKREPAKW